MEGNDLNPLIFDYFSNLFNSEVNDTDPGFLQKIQPRVTTAMNDDLSAPFTPDDVKKAIFSIGDLKAPGPDGIHAIFYKKFWHLMGEEITGEVLQAVNSCSIPAKWNETMIVLIPKIDTPDFVTQFRPISLCNVVYEII